MRKIIKQVETQIYVCEICGREHGSEYKAQSCERNCKSKVCKHEDIRYSRSIDTLDGMWIEIDKVCCQCENIIDRADVLQAMKSNPEQLFRYITEELSKKN